MVVTGMRPLTGIDWSGLRVCSVLITLYSCKIVTGAFYLEGVDYEDWMNCNVKNSLHIKK